MRVAGPERHVEEATLSASGPTALRDSGVAADLREAVGNPQQLSQNGSVAVLKATYRLLRKTQGIPEAADR